MLDRAVETAVLRGAFPDAPTRRGLLASVGAGTALAALADVFPLDAAKALAQEAAGPLEKTKLTIGYVPITCTIPILLAQAMGDYRREGLEVSLARTPGWALVRDKLASGEFDASHLVLGMPFTMTLGVGSTKIPTRVASVQNTNGNAITLAMRHKDRRDPKDWKGFKFGVPHEHSMHAMLLRHYLADNGVDPDRDVEIRVYPPPDSVANMASGNLDGMLCGVYLNPEDLAVGNTAGPAVACYRVEFRQTDIWPDYDGPPHDTLVIEIYEHWMTDAAGAA